MGRWRDSVSTVKSPTADEARPKGSLGLLKQSVTGFMASGIKVDPHSPSKRTSWFSRASWHRSSVSKTAEAAAGPSGPSGSTKEGSEPGSPGPPEPGSPVSPSSPSSPGSPGSSPEEFAVASQILEGIYGKRLDANQAVDLLAVVPEIGWLVECYCMTPVQPGWRKSKVVPGDVPLYADESTGKVFEAMPCIRDYMRLAECALQARQKPENAATAAASLQHHVQSLTVQVRRVQTEWSGPHDDDESQGSYYHNAATGVSTWEDPTHCTKFILSVAEQLLESDAFPGTGKGRPRPAEIGTAEAGPRPVKPKASEDPWLSLQKLENEGSQGRSVVLEADAFLSSFAAQAAAATPSPVQLPATSPKAAQSKRIRDVRSWQPQVPRFDSSRLSEEAANLEKSPVRRLRHIPFRTSAEDEADGKLADVRAWRPSLVRCDSSTLEEPHRDGQAEAADQSQPRILRDSAEAGSEADLRGSPEALSAPLPPASTPEAHEGPAPSPPAG